MERFVRRFRKSKQPGTNASAQPEAHRTSYAVFQDQLTPQRCDQPASGTKICEALTMFHDASHGVYAWHQTQDFLLNLTIYQFEGTYLSLAAGMDARMLGAFGIDATLVVVAEMTCTRPITGYVRLNIAFTEGDQTLFETLIVDTRPLAVRFDLAALDSGKGALRDAWIDIVLAHPAMTEVSIHGLEVRVENGSMPRDTADEQGNA